MKVRPTGLVSCVALVELLASPPASGVLMAQGISLGVLAGASSTRLNTGDGDWPGDETWRRRSGRVVTISVGVELREGWSAHGDLSYIEKGTTSTGDFEMSIRYVETPIYIRKSIGVFDPRIRPTLLAGAIISREVACGGWTSPAFPGGPRPPPVPLNCDGVRSDGADFSAIVGGGFLWAVDGVWLRTELRYVRGLTDIASAYPGVSVKHRLYALLVGLEIPITSSSPMR